MSTPDLNVRRSAVVASHPEISWSIALEARVAEEVDPDRAAARLGDAWPVDGRSGHVPSVERCTREAAADVLDRYANTAYIPGDPLCRVALVSGEPPTVIVAGHHAALDGLGLLAVLGCVLAEPIGSDVRGTDPIRAGRAATAYPFARVLEAIVRPPTRIAPVPGRPQDGDHLVSAVVDGGRGPRSAELAAAATRAVREWNREHGAGAARIVVAIGASARPGTSPSIGRDAMWFRIRVGEASADDVRRGLRHRGPEPAGPGPRGRMFAVIGGSRTMQRRTGSTMLVSNLGTIEPAGSVAEAAFFPSAHGRSGVAIGAVAVGTRTTVTVRARRRDFSQPAAEALLDLIAAQVSPDLGADAGPASAAPTA